MPGVGRAKPSVAPGHARRAQRYMAAETKKAAMQGIAAFGCSSGAVNQPILLNSDIDCICENSVCAACSAVLSSWYWLSASA